MRLNGLFESANRRWPRTSGHLCRGTTATPAEAAARGKAPSESPSLRSCYRGGFQSAAARCAGSDAPAPGCKSTKTGHGLALQQNRFARRIGLVRGDVLPVLSIAVARDRRWSGSATCPKFYRWSWRHGSDSCRQKTGLLALSGANPVEQVYGLTRFAVVVRGNLLVQQLHQGKRQRQADEKSASIRPNFFSTISRPLHALRIFVVLHFFPGDTISTSGRVVRCGFHFVLNRQLGVFRGELKNGRNGGE